MKRQKHHAAPVNERQKKILVNQIILCLILLHTLYQQWIKFQKTSKHPPTHRFARAPERLAAHRRNEHFERSSRSEVILGADAIEELDQRTDALREEFVVLEKLRGT